MECVYMKSGLRFKEPGARICTDVFSSDENGNIGLIGKSELFTIFTTEELNQHINDLQSFSKTNKLHLSGSLIIAIYNEGVAYKTIRVSNSNVKEDDVEAKIGTQAIDKPQKKKTLSMDEKVAYVKDFYREHGSWPKPSDEHKGFKIGTFWANLCKNSSLHERIQHEVE